MTDKQNAKQNMIHSLLATCRRYQTVFAHVPVFVNAIGDLENVPQFRDKAPEFYAEYFNARNIINTAARHRPNGNNNAGDNPATTE